MHTQNTHIQRMAAILLIFFTFMFLRKKLTDIAFSLPCHFLFFYFMPFSFLIFPSTLFGFILLFTFKLSH